jgi:hypothetical protein
MLLIFTNIVAAAALPAAALPGRQLTSVNGAKLSGAHASTFRKTWHAYE